MIWKKSAETVSTTNTIIQQRNLLVIAKNQRTTDLKLIMKIPAMILKRNERSKTLKLEVVVTRNEMPFGCHIVKMYLDGKEIDPVDYISQEVAKDIGTVRVGESIRIEGDYVITERFNEEYQYTETILERISKIAY